MKRNLTIAALVLALLGVGWLIFDTYSTTTAADRETREGIEAIDESLRELDEIQRRNNESE